MMQEVQFRTTSADRVRVLWVLLLLGATLFAPLNRSLHRATAAEALRVIPPNRLALDAVAGSTYQLESAPSLGPGAAWRDEGEAVVASVNRVVEWPLTTPHRMQFFRVRITRLPSGFQISESQAQNSVIAQVIRPESLTHVTLGLRWPVPLLRGTVIESASKPEDGAPRRWTVEADSYLFVVDHAPAQKLGHPFTYVLVDGASGAIRTIQAFYPPVIGGLQPLGTLRQRWNAANRFYPPSFGDLPLGKTVVFAFPPFAPGMLDGPAPPLSFLNPWQSGFRPQAGANNPCPQPGRRVAVVVASGADDEIQNDARDMGALLGNLGFQVTAFNSANHSLGAVQQGLRQALQGLGPCDKFFFYLSSHTQLVDEDDDGRPDRTPIRIDYGLGHSTQSTWSWLPRHPSSLTAILRECLAGKVNIMLDTCFAESFAVLMRQSGTLPPSGVEWNIFASSISTKTSAGATELELWLDYANDEVHSQYSGRILGSVESARAAGGMDRNNDGQVSIEEIEQAFLDAQFQAEDGLANAQMPVFTRFIGPTPAAVNDTATVPVGQRTSVAVGQNDSVPPGSRFVLVQAPALHTDLFHWDEQSGTMNVSPLTTTSDVTFSYKIVSGNLESPTATVTLTADASLNFTTRSLVDPVNPQLIIVPCLVLDLLLYPIYQFRLTNNPQDTCRQPHWHSSGDVFPIDLPTSNPAGRPDPNPPGCGFGRYSEIPQAKVPISRDVWEKFLIDHIPPL